MVTAAGKEPRHSGRGHTPARVDVVAARPAAHTCILAGDTCGTLPWPAPRAATSVVADLRALDAPAGMDRELHDVAGMKPSVARVLPALGVPALLLAVACVEPPSPGDDDYDDTLFVDDGDALEEGRADLQRSPVCDPDGELSLSACALLGTIAYAEGTHAHYDFTFAYHRFTSFADHPRLRVCAGSYCSTAAGRYQILSKTWNGVRGDLPDFSPASQDRAALRLIRGRGVTDVDGIDTYAELERAIGKLGREWASLPGSPYGQPTRSMAALWKEFQRLSGR